jgi:hypothetical protein
LNALLKIHTLNSREDDFARMIRTPPPLGAIEPFSPAAAAAAEAAQHFLSPLQLPSSTSNELETSDPCAAAAAAMDVVDAAATRAASWLWSFGYHR